jgi:predicted kinase
LGLLFPNVVLFKEKMNGLDSEETVAETKPKQPAKSWSAVAQSSVPVATSSGQSPRGVAVKPSPVGLPSLEEVVRGRNKVLIVLRGLPGSGKSTMVSKLVSDGNAYVCSADDFFVNAAGEYIWDAKRIQEAHQYSQKRALQYFELAISPVIVDNTNTMCWEAKPYVEAAVARGYAVEVLQPTTPWALNPVELAKRNKHNVSI